MIPNYCNVSKVYKDSGQRNFHALLFATDLIHREISMHFCLPQTYLTVFLSLFTLLLLFILEGKIITLLLVNNVDSNEPHSIASVWTVCLGGWGWSNTGILALGLLVHWIQFLFHFRYFPYGPIRVLSTGFQCLRHCNSAWICHW